MPLLTQRAAWELLRKHLPVPQLTCGAPASAAPPSPHLPLHATLRAYSTGGLAVRVRDLLFSSTSKYLKKLFFHLAKMFGVTLLFHQGSTYCALALSARLEQKPAFPTTWMDLMDMDCMLCGLSLHNTVESCILISKLH